MGILFIRLLNKKSLLKLAIILLSLSSTSILVKSNTNAFAIETSPVSNKENIINQPLRNLNFPDFKDQEKYQRVIQNTKTANLDQTSAGRLIQQIAEQFLGSEYKAGLLDKSPYETLVISLQQFDCLLFIETIMAIAHNINQQEYGYQAFSNSIENQRYRNGKMNGYCSRLHYFSDWIIDNQRRGNLRNITKELGGIDTVKKLNFMTTHRNSYSNLSKSDANFKCITSVENSLSDRFNYIPTNNIREVYSQLQPGDIVGVATNIAGLDFTHTGFVYHQPNGEIGLIHASPAGEVVIAQDLQTYISNVNNAIGIVVSRANHSHLTDSQQNL